MIEDDDSVQRREFEAQMQGVQAKETDKKNKSPCTSTTAED